MPRTMLARACARARVGPLQKLRVWRVAKFTERAPSVKGAFTNTDDLAGRADRYAVG